MKNIILLFFLMLSGCSTNQKTVFVPIYVDHRCFNDDGEFDDSIGADDLDCANMWFLKTTVEIKKAGSNE